MSIFKACDIRGVYPGDINEENVRRIGRAVATVLGGGDVVVGGDVRISTPALKSALIDGLMASGANVTDLGTVPTPAFYFAKAMFGATGGVMVTASHNPAEHNGLKIILGDLPITEQELARIKTLSETREFLSRHGSVQQTDALCAYRRHVASLGKGLLPEGGDLPRVVLDCGNGCCSLTAPMVFEMLSIPYVPLFCEADGAFPNRSPNSAIAANLTALSEAVVKEKADFGVAFDGDGDRVSFVDENGIVLSIDQSIAVVAKHMSPPVGAGDKVVLDIKCSSAVSDVVTALGAEALMERSGHTFIKTRMIGEGARLGGEMSGHLFYSELGGGDDGLYSAIVMANIVAKQGSLSQLAAEVPRYAVTPELRIHIHPDPRLLDTIAAAFPSEQVSRLDGVRVQFDGGWGLARLSVTEPLITLRFEARDESALAEIINRFLAPVPTLENAVKAEFLHIY